MVYWNHEIIKLATISDIREIQERMQAKMPEANTAQMRYPVSLLSVQDLESYVAQHSHTWKKDTSRIDYCLEDADAGESQHITRTTSAPLSEMSDIDIKRKGGIIHGYELRSVANREYFKITVKDQTLPQTSELDDRFVGLYLSLTYAAMPGKVKVPVEKLDSLYEAIRSCYVSRYDVERESSYTFLDGTSFGR